MALTLADSNELLMTGAEQDLFPSQIGLVHYSTTIFFDELVANDEILIRVYIKDEFDNAERRYRTTIIEGAQVNPATIVNWIPTSQYRVTCQQTIGALKTISWARYTT